MSKFDLDKFLKNYKPKVLDLSCYLQCPKLQNYYHLDDLNKLELSKTFIKYVPIADSTKDANYEQHIKTGGILVSGGIFKGSFQPTTIQSKWTHLLLKYDPNVIYDKHNNLVPGRLASPNIFVITISKNYVFYKKIKGKNRKQTKRDYFENIIDLQVELVES